MDTTHVHLLLNHFPIIGSLIGAFILLFGIWKNNTGIQKTALIIIFLMALIAIPVFLSGEPAEEKIEKIPGVIKSMIEQHEEAAELAFWFMMAAGVVSLTGYAMQLLKFSMAKPFVIISLLTSMVTAGLMVRAGYLGGQIRHTEIRSDQPVIQSAGQGSENDED